jgi:hypothetical protein
MKIETEVVNGKKVIRIYLEANLLAFTIGKKIIVLKDAPDTEALTDTINVILKSNQTLQNLSFVEYRDILRLKHFLEQEGCLLDAPDEELKPKMEI